MRSPLTGIAIAMDETSSRSLVVQRMSSSTTYSESRDIHIIAVDSDHIIFIYMSN